MANSQKIVELVVKARDEYSRVLQNAGASLDALTRKQKLQANVAIKDDIRKLEAAYKAAGAEAKGYALALKSATTAGQQDAKAARESAAALFLTRVRAQEAKTALAAKRVELAKGTSASTASFKAFSRNAQAMDVTANASARLKKELAASQSAYDQATAAATRFSTAQKSAPGITNAQNARGQIEIARRAKQEMIETQAALARLNGSAQSSFLAFSQSARGMNTASAAADDLADRQKQVVSATGAIAASQTSARGAVNGLTAAMQRQAKTPLPGGGRGSLTQGVKGEKQEIALFGLKPYQLTNLAYQANDVISGLAMGQRPIQILAQQLGQVLQIFPSFTAVFFKGIPILSGFAAVFAPIIANIAAMNAEAQNIKTFRAELALLADGANYTAEGLAKIAKATGDIKVVSDLVNRGFRQDRIEEFTKTASRMAKVTGEEVPDAVGRLADAFEGGYDSLREFDKQSNIFTASELEAIRVMYEAGDAAKAQEFAFDSLQNKLAAGASQQGGWTRAAEAFAGAWSSLKNLFQDSWVQNFIVGSLDVLAARLEAMGVGFRDLFDSINKVVGGTSTAATLAPPESIDLGKERALLEEQRKTMRDMIDLSMMLIFKRPIGQIKSPREQTQSELTQAPGGEGGFIDDQGTEAYKKRVSDLSVALAKVNEERATSIQLLGQEGRLAAEAAARAEAEAAAKLNNVSLTDAAVQQQIQGFVDAAGAAYDKEEAVRKLSEAERQAAAFIEEQTASNRTWVDTLREMTAIRDMLIEKYGQEAAVVQQLNRAMAQFSSEMSSAKGQAYSLADAARNLGAALSVLGSFDADLDSRLANASRKIQMVNQGYTEARIEAETESNASFAEANATLIREGKYSFDQVAKLSEERVAKLTKVKEAETAAIEALRVRFNPPSGGGSSGGGGGGGGGGESEQEIQGKNINRLLEFRTGLLERIKYYQDKGNAPMVAELRGSLEGVNVELTSAVDGMIKMLSTASGPEAQLALLNMQALKEEIGQAADETDRYSISAEDMNDQLANVGGSAIGKLAEALVNGKDAFTAFFDTIRQGIAEFLIDIAMAIAKQALFNALAGAGGGGGGAGGFLSKILTSVMHTGGVVGSAGATRAVSPLVFAGAARYHGGGIAGLKPNEVPAILESGPNAEEVLTADDPRHVRNGGSGGSSSINQKIVNVFDPVELLRVALADEVGQEVLVNHVSKNPRAYQTALSR